ncbi:MAG: eukaryotic-like serine/threonine-protein kinase [Betaproteobacteria bacterium]|jgi:serine/threonine protein kinase|nr:eukaryotic-like serine/threonine-protein kinase [Betaproteobacteria bacterium]
MLERIGKYEIKRELGKGATGTVYLASDPFRQAEVAIKVMEKLPADPDAARRHLRFFQNEAALAGKLRHPHIVSIFDAGIEESTGGDSLRYLVMELVEGDALTRYCEEQALLDSAKIIGIVYKCCKALEFANSIGVVHRDIKPANILVQGDFDIKVSDFGAAQLERAEVTQVSGVGSPAYMSPEQVKGEEIDFRSDMFSLGGVLYHLLTGRRPFNGGTTFALIEDILGGAPQPAAQLRPGTPAALDEVLARAMAKSRDGRFASWAEFAAALADLLEIDRKEADLSDAEKFAAARRLAFFKRFSDVELWEAVRNSHWRNHAEGEDLIREGTEDDSLYILASGLLKVTQRGKLLNAVSAGECVGEMAYARRDGNVRSATVTAVQQSWAMRLRVQDIDGLSEGCRARFIEAFLAIMAERLAMLGNRLVARV